MDFFGLDFGVGVELGLEWIGFGPELSWIALALGHRVDWGWCWFLLDFRSSRLGLGWGGSGFVLVELRFGLSRLGMVRGWVGWGRVRCRSARFGSNWVCFWFVFGSGRLGLGWVGFGLGLG